MPSLADIADVLNGLLDAELASPFAPTMISMPHFGRMAGSTRRAFRYIASADARRAQDLRDLLELLGLEHHVGHQRPPPVESYLSVTYVLPTLLASKETTLQQYRDAVATIGESAPPVADLLRRHISEHAGELEVLRQLQTG